MRNEGYTVGNRSDAVSLRVIACPGSRRSQSEQSNGAPAEPGRTSAVRDAPSLECRRQERLHWAQGKTLILLTGGRSPPPYAPPASACRPKSVIVSRVTSIGRLPTYVHAAQALARRLLLPVRPRVGADDPATRADHPRPEHLHWHIIRPRRLTDDRPVVAVPARHVERPHAVRAHVAERHWLDRFFEVSGRHARGLRRLPPAWQDNRLAGVESIRRRVAPCRAVWPTRSWRSGAGARLRAIRARGPSARLANPASIYAQA